MYLDFPGSSADKESAGNVGDPPVQFLGQEDLLDRLPTSVFLGFCVVTQLIKNPPAMQKAWV